MPMVWYIPPLSPVVDALANTGHDAEDKGNLFAAIEAMRIPIGYLANLMTAGDVSVVDGVLRRLAAMRAYMRDINLGRDADESIAEAVGLTGEEVYEMYRLLAIAKYEHRYVIPAAHREAAEALEESPGCSLDFEGGPGMQGSIGRRQGPDPGVDRELPPHQAARRGRALRDRCPRREESDERPDRDPPPARRVLAAAQLPRPGDGRPHPARPRAPRRAARRTRATRSRGSSTGSTSTDVLRAQEHYVEIFDRRRKACLYLTYFLNGDTRGRGMALVGFKEAYQSVGFTIDDGELPDFLPVVLEFGAVGDLEAALRHPRAQPRRARAAAPRARRLRLAVRRGRRRPAHGRAHRHGADRRPRSSPRAGRRPRWSGLTPFIPVESLRVGART